MAFAFFRIAACIANARRLAAGELVRRVQARRSAPVFALRRLGGAQVAAMVHSCTGGATSDTVERAIALADGVPFLVEEMLVAPGVPTSFADGVEARLAELSEGDRRVLVAAAAFGRHFDWRLLPSAAGTRPVTNIRNLRSLYLRGWMAPKSRCLVLVIEFWEWTDTRPEEAQTASLSRWRTAD